MIISNIKKELESGYVDNDMLVFLNETLPSGLLPKFSLQEQTAESFDKNGLVRYINSELNHNMPLDEEEKKILLDNKELVLELADSMTALSITIPSREKTIDIEGKDVKVNTIKEPLLKELEVEQALLRDLPIDATVEDFVRWANGNPYGKIVKGIYTSDGITNERVDYKTHSLVELISDVEDTKTTLSYVNKLVDELPTNVFAEHFGI